MVWGIELTSQWIGWLSALARPLCNKSTSKHAAPPDALFPCPSHCTEGGTLQSTGTNRPQQAEDAWERENVQDYQGLDDQTCELTVNYLIPNGALCEKGVLSCLAFLSWPEAVGAVALPFD